METGTRSSSGPCVRERGDVAEGAARSLWVDIREAASMSLGVTGSHWPQREVAQHGAAEGQSCPGWTEDDSGVRKPLFLSPGLGFWAAFCPALCKHQVRSMRNQRWALLVSTSPPSACWFLPELPAPPRPWLWALWSGPGPERTVPSLCPYSLAGSLPALHWASAQPQGHCCSHTGAR